MHCAYMLADTITRDNTFPGAELLASMNYSDALIELGSDSLLVIAATASCGGGVPWVVRTPVFQLPNAPLFQQYLTSLYWSVATIVRNPWIAPDTSYEKLFTSTAIIFGTIAFALIIGNVNAMVRTYDEASAARRRRLASIRVFMTFHNLPTGLQQKMLSYAEGDWQMTAGITIEKALGPLPSVLRSQVLMRIHADLRMECPLLQGLPRECVCQLIGQLHPQLCLQGESLIEPGQLLWELFMLRRGSLSIKRAHADSLARQATVSAEKWDKHKGAHAHLSHGRNAPSRARRGAQMDSYFRMIDKPGQYVGLVHPFDKPPRALFRVSAVKQCQLLRVTQSILWQVLSHFGPEVQERFCEALRDHYDATLAALKLPAHDWKSTHGEETGGGAFHTSFGGGYAVEEILERRTRTEQPTARTGIGGVSVMQKQADIDEATHRIEEMRGTLAECEARTASLLQGAASLPGMCEALLRVQHNLSKRSQLPKLASGLMDPPGNEEETVTVVKSTPSRQMAKPGLMRQPTRMFGNVAGGTKSAGAKPGGLARQGTRNLFSRPAQPRSLSPSQNPSTAPDPDSFDHSNPCAA